MKWIQHVVNECPDALNNPIKNFLHDNRKLTIEWISPRRDDDYSEYRDQAFLDLLGIRLGKKRLKDFWPSRGPQWDALGRIKGKAYFLVEAKAHISEFISSSQAKSPASKSLIRKSLKETGAYLKLNRQVDLTEDSAQAMKQMHEGVALTLKQLDSAFEKSGITVVDPTGEKFNPELHQAMSMIETDDVEPNHVVNVMQKGYILNERLLRPAMVVVAKTPAQAAAESGELGDTES